MTTSHALDYAPKPPARYWAALAVRILLAALIPLALFEAYKLAPDRDAESDHWKEMDFAVFYTAGRAFVAGHDPYVRADAERQWQAAGGDDDVMDVLNGPYPGDEASPDDRSDHWLPVELIPPGLTVMAAFALMPVPLAWPVWNYAVALLLVGQLYATVKLMRRPLWDWASLAVILFTILLEPLHWGLANGQPTVPAISLLVLALYWASRDRHAAAGVAFAVAVALKPQVAAPFVLLLMYQRRWPTVLVAAGVGAALTWAAVVPMQVGHADWLHTWLGQLDQAEGAGNIDSARVSNVGRNDLLNLALIGHLFTDRAKVVNTTTVTLFFAAVGGLFWYARDRRQSLVVTAVFAVLALLPMYHRYYDAGLLVLPIGWAVATLARPRTDPGDGPVAAPPGWTTVNLADRRARWAAVAVLAVSAVFLFPSEWLVARFRESSEETQRRWWFNWLLEPHHAWELLAILAAVTAGLVVTRGRPGPTAGPVPAASPWWGRHGVRLAVAALIPLAALDAWWLTPDHDMYKELDFAMYYTASRTLVKGGNPYDRGTSFATWTDADGDYDVLDYIMGRNPWDEGHPEYYWLPINCIPPALAVIAPIAYFNVPHAWPTWNTIVGLLWLGQGLAVVWLMRVRLWSVAALVMVIGALLLDPLHIGLANGQPAVPAVALTVIACGLAAYNWQLTAGVAIAVATALKPQLGGPFVLLFLWQRRVKAVVAAAVVGVALTAAAVVPMTRHNHLAWLTGDRSWTEEVHFAELPGQVNDARKADFGRHDMIHLQVLLHFFTDDAKVVNGVTAVIIAGLGYLLWRAGRDRPTDLGVISGFAVLALLFAYHRFYDAGVLVLPLAWGVVHGGRGPARWPARAALVLVSLYFMQQLYVDEQWFGPRYDDAMARRWWFNLFVEPHHQWELLGLFACLVIGLRRQRVPTVASPTRAAETFHGTATPMLAGA